MSITAANLYEGEDRQPLISVKGAPLQNQFGNSVDWDLHAKLLMSSETIDETKDTAANDDTIDTFEFAPPFDKTTNFNQLIRQIENMRWSDPIGATYQLLEIDTEHLPFKFYDAYRTLAEDLGTQLKYVEGVEAQIALWDLTRSTQELETSIGLFGANPAEELLQIFGESSMQSLNADITDFMVRHTENETGLPDNAGLISKMATLQYTKHEAERLDALPTGQYNPDIAAAEKRRELEYTAIF